MLSESTDESGKKTIGVPSLSPDFLIETLPQTITADRPNRYPTPITANGYLHERLVEIGLIKK